MRPEAVARRDFPSEYAIVLSTSVDVHVVSTGAGFYYYDMEAQTVAAIHWECNDKVHQMTLDYPTGSRASPRSHAGH